MGGGNLATAAVAWASDTQAGVLPGRASYLGGHDGQVGWVGMRFSRRDTRVALMRHL